MKGSTLESLVALEALGVCSFESATLGGLFRSSPKSLGAGIGVGGSEELKGSEEGSIPLRASAAYKAL